jgi:hypothetical protein
LDSVFPVSPASDHDFPAVSVTFVLNYNVHELGVIETADVLNVKKKPVFLQPRQPWPETPKWLGQAVDA